MQSDSHLAPRRKERMKAFKKLITTLRDPRLQGVDPYSDECLILHREILQSKPMMRSVFVDFYRLIRRMDERWFSGHGLRLEVGAGTSFIKSLYPDVIVSDVKQSEHLDQVIDATQTPFQDSTLRALYGINCFHHFPSAEAFFLEMRRVITPGGGVILIEPYFGLLARTIFRNLHDCEDFDMTQQSWSNPELTETKGRANQALSYLVFHRDRARFEKQFPDFEIVETKTLSQTFCYLLSGGLNFYQLVPNWTVPFIKAFDALLSPLGRWVALFHLVVIRRRHT